MENEKNMHRSTERVLDILMLVAEHPQQYTQTEICQALDAPKSSLFPILYTLVAKGFLAIDQTGHYGIGRSTYLLGAACLSEMDVWREVELVLQELTEASGETSHFAVLNQGNVLYLKKKDSTAFIGMTSRVGIQMPAYGTALGKALLLDHTQEQLEKLYPHGLTYLTDNTLKTLDDLFEQLQMARVEDITWEIEESTPHIRCFGTPIRKNGVILAAVSVAIPAFRYTDELGILVKKQLKLAKTRLEALLQGTDSVLFAKEAERLM